ncbi:LysR family transcriptional regulator [Sphingopyxis sp.]|uniref:LysR family transcriptional regulator n=1 Tax=Sphingopyxis sp. TaxID=1908224 RepID=UPI003D6CDAF9
MIDPRTLFHPMLLRSFVAVAEEHGFSRAARRLNLRQSTLSQHIVRLEEAVGHPLFWRTTRETSLTPAGEEMLDHARTILASYERAHRGLHSSALEGKVRMGASEEFAIQRLPSILSHFKRIHDGVDLAVTIAPSTELEAKFAAGDLDLMVVERRAGLPGGHRLRSESIFWYAVPGFTPDTDAPIPMVMYKAPHLIRDIVVAEFERNGQQWREVCTGSSFLGLRAAAMAGLGLAALSTTANPLSLERVKFEKILPRLPQIDLVLVTRGDDDAVRELDRLIRSTQIA